MKAWIRPVLAGGGVLALVAGLVLAFQYVTHGRFVQDTNDAAIQADQVVISSKLAGYVHTVLVADNQQVNAGALLLEIDPTDYSTRVATARAAYAAALATGKTTSATRAEAEAARDQAQAGLQSAQSQLDFAERELARYRPLVASGAESGSLLSQLTVNRDKAAAEASAQRAALRQASLRIETITAQFGESAAQADAARVQQVAAANDLASTRIVAPLAGRIAGKSARVGQYVQPGTRLMTVVPSDQSYIVANFKETQLANFSLIPPTNATGNFTKIVQRVPVRIAIVAGPAARKVLVPGLSIEVAVDTSAQKAELDAIRREQGQQAQ